MKSVFSPFRETGLQMLKLDSLVCLFRVLDCVECGVKALFCHNGGLQGELQFKQNFLDGCEMASTESRLGL